MATPVSSPQTSYEPRRSNVQANETEGDGDIWQEKLAVCESSTSEGNPKLLIRSYYRNNRTGDRVWDEPPSGASQVNYATPDMRRMAQVQLTELQSTLEMIPPDDAWNENDHGDSNGSNSNSNKSRKKGFLGGMFKRSAKPKKSVEPSKDLNLQRAIVRSMTDQGGPNSRNNGSNGSNDDVRVHLDLHSIDEDDDPDLALAKALSLSEYDSAVRGDFKSSYDVDVP